MIRAENRLVDPQRPLVGRLGPRVIALIIQHPAQVIISVTQYLIPASWAQEPSTPQGTLSVPASPHHAGGGETYAELILKYGDVVLSCGRPRSGDRHAREPVPGFRAYHCIQASQV